MRSKIYTVLASAALMAAAGLATNSAMAETTLNVPFSFMVAGKACPAGHYTVKENPIGTFVTLTNQDSSRVFTWILLPSSPDFKNGDVVLTHTQEAANPNNHGVDLAVLVQDQLIDVAELFIGFIVDVEAHQLGGAPVVLEHHLL